MGSYLERECIPLRCSNMVWIISSSILYYLVTKISERYVPTRYKKGHETRRDKVSFILYFCLLTLHFIISPGDNLDNEGNSNQKCGGPYTLTSSQEKSFFCTPGIKGRYVNIQIAGNNKKLAICEVSVNPNPTGGLWTSSLQIGRRKKCKCSGYKNSEKGRKCGMNRPDEGLTLETSAFKLFTVANWRLKLSC